MSELRNEIHAVVGEEEFADRIEIVVDLFNLTCWETDGQREDYEQAAKSAGVLDELLTSWTGRWHACYLLGFDPEVQNRYEAMKESIRWFRQAAEAAVKGDTPRKTKVREARPIIRVIADEWRHYFQKEPTCWVDEKSGVPSKFVQVTNRALQAAGLQTMSHKKISEALDDGLGSLTE